MDQNVLYRGQRLTLTRFWATGEPCLWISIFLKNLTEAELAQITSLDGTPLDMKEERNDIE